MGARGPSPIPTEQRIREGNRSRRPLPVDEPKPRRLTSLPPPPESLEGPGVDMWHELGDKLIRDKVLADTHLYALEMLCGTWFRVQVLLDDLRESGYTQMVPKFDAEGIVVAEVERARPQVAMMKEAEASFKNWCTRFGLDPSSMTRVKVIEDEKGGDGESEEERLLRELEGDGKEKGMRLIK